MNKDFHTAIEMYRQLKYILSKKQRRNSIWVLMSIIIGAAVETLGISAIIPFLQVILEPETLMKNKYVATVMNFLNINSAIMLTIMIGVAICLIYILKNVYLAWTSYLQIKFQCNLQKELSILMLKSYMKRPYAYFLDINSGEILRGINNDIGGVYALLNYCFKFIAEALTVIAIGIFVLLTDPLLASGVLILAGGCLIGIIILFKKRLKRLGEEQRDCFALRGKITYQTIMGIKEIMVMHREKYFSEEYKKVYERQNKADISFIFAGSCPERIIEAVCITGIIGAVCVRIFSGMDTVTFVPTLGAFAVAAFRVLPAVSRMTGYLNGIIFYRTTLEATYNNVLEIREFSKENSEYINNYKDDKSSLLFEENGFCEEVVINDICWKYKNSDNYVLSHLNLKIKKGQSIALIGASGAGKTTLADIILGLLKPQEGQVLVDGNDIFTIPLQWSKTIGYVPQSVFLIDDTIYNNVVFGNEMGGNTQERVWEALEQAQLKEHVEKLPEGLNTIVGERGIKFSGGQRQRVAIARALYYNPDILVLDEATSALDNETEVAVMQAIESLQGKKTLIIVAHRLSTVKKCDMIYEIVDGKAILRNKDSILK